MKGSLYKLLSVLILPIIFIQSDDDFSSFKYQSTSSKDKMNKIWGKLSENQTPYGWYSQFTLGQIFLYDMSKSFTTYSDSMIEGRKKLIHSVGVVGKVEFESVPSPYTGIFKGCKNVILRLSAAKEPDTTKTTPEGAESNFTPGFGIKFLRDSMPSANLVAMFSVDGQPSWNFFKNDFSNHVPAPDGLDVKLLAVKFGTAQKEIGTIGLKTLAQYDEMGKANEAHFPFKLIFRPRKEIKSRFSDSYVNNFVDQLKTIEVNTPLYDVLAVPTLGEKTIKVGTLVTKTKFITSNWGDKSLFFQHNFIEDDFQVHPEWRDVVDNEFMKKYHTYLK